MMLNENTSHRPRRSPRIVICDRPSNNPKSGALIPSFREQASWISIKSALIAASAYFLALFSLGFVLGMVRVIIVAPRIGELAATIAEAPLMLLAGFILCRWALRHWEISQLTIVRWTMVLWFLFLLIMFEALFGAALFGRTASAQWDAIASPTGAIGLFAQIVTALFPMLFRRFQRNGSAGAASALFEQASTTATFRFGERRI